MVFCDDALGSHLGGSLLRPRVRGPFDLHDRFWQEAAWASNVTAFAWDRNGKCLYVSTSGTYGTGDLFALNLRARRFTKIPLRLTGTLLPNYTYVTTLKNLDMIKNVLIYEIEYFDAAQGKTANESLSLALPACGDE
jgi:hypothetical protein